MDNGNAGQWLGASDFPVYREDLDQPPESWHAEAKACWGELADEIRAECVLAEFRLNDCLDENARLRGVPESKPPEVAVFSDHLSRPPSSWRGSTKSAWKSVPTPVQAQCVLADRRTVLLLSENAALKKTKRVRVL
jgi:hypothetical protein